MTGKGHTHAMSQEEKDHIAQEKFGKPFEELDTNEKKTVGALHHSKQMMGPEGGQQQEGAPTPAHHTRSHK
ncbi:hypothetical protein CHLRE_09g395213v5 [Chlamydomonas reinhardtii]|uniref:Uncharacterized protein n=1 Tax=Chlamydomonas reinhardtii TaxID=3055 RepID=A8J0C6_CHLRE|nr:uncharacterized protein CHLRE_09g395213v5 [Chlamydomonas reinhardtii]PNW78940.1 hypothetical protein CHLRE_09g395213v5 [Chlamydomonas reinhardtii]|eukprot:XP_001694690.1 predicted protein [Chlamydomonas reinhardtii]